MRRDGTNLLAEWLRLQKGFGLDEYTRLRKESAEPARQTLEELSSSMSACRDCRLSEDRRRVVFGEGDPEADLVFVGEGPGAEEDRQGRPFVGKAGILLTRIIESIGLTREQVYIANVVKCRPPRNRNPEPDEIGKCMPKLVEQLKLIEPRVICALGAVAAHALLDTESSIGRLRGRFHEWEGVPVMPTYHPAYLLRNPGMKRRVWEDMKQVRAFLTGEEKS